MTLRVGPIEQRLRLLQRRATQVGITDRIEDHIMCRQRFL